jgi:hypothetical protein
LSNTNEIIKAKTIQRDSENAGIPTFKTNSTFRGNGENNGNDQGTGDIPVKTKNPYKGISR